MAKLYNREDAERLLNEKFKRKVVEITYFKHFQEKKFVDVCEYVVVDDTKDSPQLVFMFFDIRMALDFSDVPTYVKILNKEHGSTNERKE